jgi:sugar/nucleoside kinase (ribokinase family)
VAGGLTSNAGVTMARMGMKVGVFSYVGPDFWAEHLRDIYRRENIDGSLLATLPDEATSTTLVAIDPSGERSFLHCPGATARLDARAFLERSDLWRRTRLLFLGYYSLLPRLEPELPEVFAAVRAAGCQTALDSGGSGGAMQPLEKILPHTDVYVPSLAEAAHQTGLDDPRDMIRRYRDCGAPGVLGVKLGSKGVLLSAKGNETIEIGICSPPGPVVDTTGAGDCFYAGLLTGLLRGLSVEQAGRLGASAAACCVTALGGSTGGRDYDFTRRLAGL